MSLYGMDLEQGRELAQQLGRAGERFSLLSTQLTPMIRNADWAGTDGAGFRNDWNGHNQQLLAAARALLAAAESVRDNVRQQEEASNPAAGGGTGGGSGEGPSPQPAPNEPAKPEDREEPDEKDDDSLWGNFKDGVGNVKDSVTGAVETSWDNLSDAAGDQLNSYADFGRLGWDYLTTGEPPSITELVTAGTQVAAGQLNFLATVATSGQYHPHLLDDGSPTATEGQGVGVGDDPAVAGHRNTPVPESLSAIMGGVTSAYDDVGKSGTPDAAIRITTVNNADGPAYIVAIPGTSEWNVQSGTNPMDTVGNLSSASGDLSTASRAVQLAMENAGIPSDAPVMLVGHSQGGLTAAALASDDGFREDFNVTNVAVYGAPIDSARIPDSVQAVSIQHEYDLVPRLDLGNDKPPLIAGMPATPWSSSHNATVVTLPTPDGAGPGSLTANHDYNKYTDSVLEHQDSGLLAGYANHPSMDPFLTDDPGQVSSSAYGISREQ